MYSQDSYEMKNKEALAFIESKIKSVELECEQRLKPWKEKKLILEKAMLVYEEVKGSNPTENISLSPDEVRGKSQKELLKLIASKNNGILVVNKAVKIMKTAHVFGNPTNAASAIYSILRRSQDEFEKIGGGLYQLINVHIGMPTVRGSVIKRHRTISGVKSAVKELKEKNPNYTRDEVINTLVSSGFNFQNKSPKRAVHMAWLRLGYYSKENKNSNLVAAQQLLPMNSSN